jgi:protein required for attachment to host cells
MFNFKLKAHDWAIVLDGRKALFLQNQGDGVHPNLVTREVREHPDLPNRELHTDRPGKVHQSAASAHSAVELTDRHDEAERIFIEGVATRLGELVAAGKGNRMIIVAPPRALGMVRKTYTPALRAAISAEIDHDWVHLPVNEIEGRLKQGAKGTAA